MRPELQMFRSRPARPPPAGAGLAIATGRGERMSHGGVRHHRMALARGMLSGQNELVVGAPPFLHTLRVRGRSYRQEAGFRTPKMPFAAGPGVMAAVKIPRSPRGQEELAPRTWSSQPSCFQEGGLHTSTFHQDGVPSMVGWESLGG
jgi:hypothetical protein